MYLCGFHENSIFPDCYYSYMSSCGHRELRALAFRSLEAYVRVDLCLKTQRKAFPPVSQWFLSTSLYFRQVLPQESVFPVPLCFFPSMVLPVNSCAFSVVFNNCMKNFSLPLQLFSLPSLLSQLGFPQGVEVKGT